MRLRRLAPLTAVIASLVAAAPATATSVYLKGNGQQKTLHIDGAAGEVNTPQVWPYDDGGKLVYLVIDYSSGPIAGAGSGCTQTDATQVSCPQAPVVAANVSLGDGNDSFTVIFNPLTIPMTVDGGPGNDSLAASDGDDAVTGGTGDDYVRASGAGADDYSGGDGTDAIGFERGGAQFISLDDVADDGLAGEGDNAHTDFEGVWGGNGDDTITGTAGNDALHGGGGADIIHGGAGNDVVGGYGDANTSHDCSADQVFGDEGDDRIEGTASGSAEGGTGDDVIATDLLCSGLVVHGGDGHDRVDASSAYYGVAVTLDDSANDGPAQTAAANVHGDVEDLTGSWAPDRLTGDGAANDIDGGPGNDVLDGAGGADTITGGDGTDLVDYSSRTAPLSVDLDGTAGDDGETGEGDSVGSDVEGIWGGSAADVLTGGPGDDSIDGGLGADQISGGPGEDAADYSGRTAAVFADLTGSTGDDGESGEGDSIAADVEDLFGGDGNDKLTGGPGDNYLDGSGGNDNLDGGAGMDAFVAGDGDDTVAMRDDVAEEAFCGEGADSVTADTTDTADGDCETVLRPVVAQPTRTSPTRTTPTRTSPIRTPIPPTRPAASDLAAPKLILVPSKVGVKRAVTRGITFRVSCDEDCSTQIQLTLSLKQLKRLGFAHAKRPVIVARGEHFSADASVYRVVVRFKAALRKKIGKARSLRLEGSVLLKDRSNNAVRRPLSVLKLAR